MDKPSSFRQIKIFYYRYKDTSYFLYGLIGVILLVCILQFVFIIIPVWQQLMVVRSEEDAIRENIAVMEANSVYISSVNPSTQRSQRSSVLAALPITKDYAGIYNAIITGASRTGVVLSEFSYNVGELDPSEREGSVAQMKVELNVVGSITNVNGFVKTLRELLPLSDVQNYSGDLGESSVSIAFFYGGEGLPIAIDNTQPLAPLSPEKEKLLNTISSYMPPVETVVVSQDTSSASAFSQPPF